MDEICNQRQINKTLYESLVEYKKDDIYPMHMPGHKRNLDLCHMGNPYGIDITEIDGFDNLHEASGILDELAKRTANVFRAKKSFLLVNGSTVGILTAMSAATHVGDTILISRNCHKSVYHAAMLRQLKIEYLFPEQVHAVDVSITKEAVEEAFMKYKDIKLVVITSPTYEGVVSDIKQIAEIVHRYGAKLLVDEAHGAHLCFSDEFPESATIGNADYIVQSLHKTLPCLTQTAVLHSNQEKDHDLIRFYLSIYETSSPSYLLLSSIDQCITLLERQADELFERYTRRLKNLHDKLNQFKSMTNLQQFREDSRFFGLDSSKIVLLTNMTDISGFYLHQTLLKDYKIQMEMAVVNYALGMTSICDTDEGFERLVNACQAIDRTWSVNNSFKQEYDKEDTLMYPKKHFELYETVQMEKIRMKLSDSLGKVAGTYICLYPPGSPILVPGEEITKYNIETLLKAQRTGLTVTGIKDDEIVVLAG